MRSYIPLATAFGICLVSLINTKGAVVIDAIILTSLGLDGYYVRSGQLHQTYTLGMKHSTQMLAIMLSDMFSLKSLCSIIYITISLLFLPSLNLALSSVISLTSVILFSSALRELSVRLERIAIGARILYAVLTVTLLSATLSGWPFISNTYNPSLLRILFTPWFSIASGGISFVIIGLTLHYKPMRSESLIQRMSWWSI